jgi:hypothetical protein
VKAVMLVLRFRSDRWQRVAALSAPAAASAAPGKPSVAASR